MAHHNDLGKKGEVLAVNLLLEKGYQILEKNYRFLKAEVDIIAQKENTLVAVEVKTRTSNYFGRPEDSINQKKIKLLTEAVNNYVIKKDLDLEVRFDVISIIYKKNKIETNHIKDAFLYF